MKKLWLGFAMSSVILLAACGNENETASENVEAVQIENEYAEIDEKMHEFAVAQIVGAEDYLNGLFYEGDRDKYKGRIVNDGTLPNSFEDLKYYFQMRNIGNDYEIWRTNFYESEGFLLYVIRYHHEPDDTKYAKSFVAEKIDGEWQIRYSNSFGFRSPHLESNFKRGKVTGSGILRLIDLYPELASEIITREQTNSYFETLTSEKRQEIQQHIDTREAYYD